MKGTVAELVINEIACLDPPGRFLEPQADQRFREVSRKRAIEKTCQALREKKNNIGRPQNVAQDPSEKQPQAAVVPKVVMPSTNEKEPNPTAMEVDKETPPPVAIAAKEEIKPDANPTEGAKDAVVTIM